MSTSDKFRKFSEMTSQNDFIQALERLVSGNAAVDSSAAGTYETGINRPLGRLARNTDALLDVLQATKSCVLEAANNDVVMSYTSTGSLFITGTTGVRIRLHSEIGGAKFNKVSSNASALLTGLSAGKVIYVQLNRTSDATVALQAAANWGAFVTAATNANRLDYMVFGLVTPNNDIVLFNGMTLRKDQKLENALATDSQYGQRFVQQQNRNLFMTGGDLTFDHTANTITIDQIKIHAPGNGSTVETTVAAGTYGSFTNGSCLVAVLNRTGTSTVTPTVQALSAVTINKDTEHLFVIAFRLDNNFVHLANGDRLRRTDSHSIGADIKAFTYVDPYTGSPLTSNLFGDVELKQSGAMILEPKDFSTGSVIRFKNRKDNRQVFIKTTLKYELPSTGSATLTFGSAVLTDGILVSHPDYAIGAGPAVAGLNRICPSGGVISFASDRQVAYVVLQPINSIGNSDFTATVANDHVSAGHTAITSAGNIYVCDMDSVPEDDAEVFVFAQRVDELDSCILWDGTYLHKSMQSEATLVGMPLDRAIKQQSDFNYSHGTINFEWVRSGQNDSLGGGSSVGDRIAINWAFVIEILWPSGAVTRIMPVTSSINLYSPDKMVAYVTVPLKDRVGSGFSTTTLTVQTGDRTVLSDIANFALFRLPDFNVPNSAVPPQSIDRAYRKHVVVFGNRVVRQRYEVSGGATSALTGNAFLGRTSTLSEMGDDDFSVAIHRAAYPSATNPFLTASSVTDLKVGAYTGAAFEGGSTTFVPSFSVTAASGVVQAVDYTYGDTAGASATKTKSVFYTTVELEETGGLISPTPAGRFTSDLATGSNTITFQDLYHLNTGLQQTGTTAFGTVRSASVPAGKSTAVRFRVLAGSKLQEIKVHVARGTGFALPSVVRIRASKNSRFSHIITSGSTTFTLASGTALLTNGVVSTTDGIEMVSPSSSVPVGSPTLQKIYGRADFSFLTAGVAGPLPPQVFGDTDELFLRIGNSSGVLPLEILGVEIVVSGSSVEDLLGAG